MTREILEALDASAPGERDSRFEERDSRGERIAAASERGSVAMTGERDSRFEDRDSGGERIAAASERGSVAMTGEPRSEIRETRIEETRDAGDARSSNLKTQIAIRAHLDSLRAQAEQLRQEFPDFDLDAALRDPDFLRLTAPGLGVDLRRAYYALNRDALEARTARRAAEETRRQLARSVAAGGLRPREGGGQQAAAELATDYRQLSRSQQQALKQRIIEAAARGEKLYP